jgi:hypothetical protein
MASVVLIGAEQPLFVIPEQRHHESLRRTLKIDDSLDTSLRIGTPIDVVPEKDNYVLRTDLQRDPTEKVVQGREVAVHITDRYRAHIDALPLARSLWFSITQGV